MIVIATHNGKTVLQDLLSDLTDIKCVIPISVIDTGSSDELSLSYLKQLREIFPQLNINVYSTLEKNWDTGAYMFAIKHLKANKYYFLQDSIRILRQDIFNKIDDLLQPKTVVAFRYFLGKTDKWFHKVGRDLCRKNFNSLDYDVGIFGPIFCILREDIDRCWDTLPKFLPTTKREACGMERGWGIFCKLNNLKIVSLTQESILQGIEHNFFEKIFMNRK